MREFQLAVDKLESLVVQRLFELTKANLSGTGTLQFYKRFMTLFLYQNRLQALDADQQGTANSVKSNTDSPQTL